MFQEQVLSDQELIQKMVECADDIDTPDLKYEFNLFFCIQFFRSPKIHGNLSKSFEDFKKTVSWLFWPEKQTFFVKLITLYYAQKMALNITQNLKSKLVVYENRTALPFITGDTPIVYTRVRAPNWRCFTIPFHLRLLSVWWFPIYSHSRRMKLYRLTMSPR